jgi:hypothetical protein
MLNKKALQFGFKVFLFELISSHSFSHIPTEVIKINWVTAPQYEFVHKLNPQKSITSCMDRYLQSEAARLTLHCSFSLTELISFDEQSCNTMLSELFCPPHIEVIFYCGCK